MAYADYNDLMDLTETLIAGMVFAIKGTHIVQYHKVWTFDSNQFQHL